MNAWLQGATVDVEYEVEQTPGESPTFIADPDRTLLDLPEIGLTELEKLPEEFDIKVIKTLEDDQARFEKYQFIFHVKIKGSTQKPNGKYQLNYSASLIDYGPKE
jgi:hypothetical protein